MIFNRNALNTFSDFKISVTEQYCGNLHDFEIAETVNEENNHRNSDYI